MKLPATVGLGWRPSLAAALLDDPARVGFLEVVAEAAFASEQTARELEAATRLWPIVPHGVKLSLASADGVRPGHVSRLGALATRLRAPCVSEHVAITRGGEFEIGHLTPAARTHARVALIADNIRHAQAHLPVPLLVENIAAPFWYVGGAEDDDLDDGAFYSAIVAAAGCGLLLDVSNLYANARNAGHDPVDRLRRFPLHAVEMIHIAGGVVDNSGYYHDTHAHPIPENVFGLLAAALRETGPVPTLIERDADFDDLPALFAEVDRCRELVAASAGRRRPAPTTPTPALTTDPARTAAMAALDRAVAAAITGEAAGDAADNDTAAAVGIDAAGLRRTRQLLRRKRVDDALPLLPRLSLRRDAHDVAARALAGFPRRAADNAVRDAWRIADAIVSGEGDDGDLFDDAAIDLLLLRARFAGNPLRDGSALRRRVWPFVGAADLSGGRRALAFKGPGASAGIRVHHPSVRVRTRDLVSGALHEQHPTAHHP